MRGDLQEGYFALLDANFLSSWCQFPFSRAQNRGFCAFLAFRTPVFRHFEHEIGIFVLFLPSEPPFSGISSTKSRFLCAFSLRDPHFWHFRAQNRHFCARGSLFRGGVLGMGYSGILPGECCSCPEGAARGVARSICLIQGVRRALF